MTNQSTNTRLAARRFFASYNPETKTYSNLISLDECQIHALPSKDDEPKEPIKSFKLEIPKVTMTFTLTGEQANWFRRLFFPTPLEQFVQRLSRWFSQN